MNSADSVTRIAGVGEAVAAKYAKLGIRSIRDLIEYVPFRYDDYSEVRPISAIRPGPVTVRAIFSSVTQRYSKKGLHVTEATARDATGSVKIVWFNQRYRAQSLKQDTEYFISGEFAQNYKYLAISNPACELVSSFPVNTARLVPIYRTTKGLGIAQIRRSLRTVLSNIHIQETLPDWLVSQEKLLDKATALKEMHFPTNVPMLTQAKMRLGFEEIFQLALASELNKLELKGKHSKSIPIDSVFFKEFVSALPFSLTDDQRSVTWTILQDMASDSPMNRLVEGDVGSGKTLVAILAALSAIRAGFQVAFMAPTELLATQHAATIARFLKNTEYEHASILLTGGLVATEKQYVQEKIALGEYKFIVGTHALFQDAVTFDSLGLVIVDEQHRFGVDQRKALQTKSSGMPHVLHMTATPIPRSLALTLYGELDVSVIKHLPPGRKPIATEVYISEQREQVYTQALRHIREGRQVFVVCPQIDEGESPKLSVKKIHDQLSKTWLKGCTIGLLHGKMKSDEKERVMKEFVSGNSNVLVATTVIEVGVDVPNANYMVIEGADRYGLAQLHQLRGRVGRGEYSSYCALVTEGNDAPPKRLQLMKTESSGFVLAEHDLRIRGPGAIYGVSQHGALDLRVAQLDDVELIKRAKDAAKQFVVSGEELVKYSELDARVAYLRSVTNLN